MFDVKRSELRQGVHHYAVMQQDATLSYRDALGLWSSDGRFGAFLSHTLSESPFEAFLWETPAISTILASRDFEFVLIDDSTLLVPPDPHTFARQFARDDTGTGVVTFENLGGDATLVAPTPEREPERYSHLAAFVRGACRDQQKALWRALGNAATERLSDKPLWISTHGGGVAWVHVRLDARPKYYSHRPFIEPG